MWLRLMLVAVILGVGMSVSPAAADTYQFPNNTLVQAYYKNNPYSYNGSYWHDRIGALVYEVYGVNIVGTTFQIYTNMPSGGDTQYGIPVADFFLDIGNDGTWDFAVNMEEKSPDIYQSPVYKTSQDIFQNLYNGTYFIYGGRYDADGTSGPPYTPKPIPVQIASGSDIGDASVSWTWLGSSGPNYRIDIVMPADFWNTYLAGQTFAFIWGSGICANDTAQGVFKATGVVVPLPGSLLLLGSGLLGLAALGRGIQKCR